MTSHSIPKYFCQLGPKLAEIFAQNIFFLVELYNPNSILFEVSGGFLILFRTGWESKVITHH